MHELKHLFKSKRAFFVNTKNGYHYITVDATQNIRLFVYNEKNVHSENFNKIGILFNTKK